MNSYLEVLVLSHNFSLLFKKKSQMSSLLMLLFQRTIGKRTGGCRHQVEQRKAQHLFQGESVHKESYVWFDM